jgi:hypothetical protein
MKRTIGSEASNASTATVGHEAQLWQMADALRARMKGRDAGLPEDVAGEVR